ncbi:MAG: SRPBCC domain-containing protein [Saccharospirillum sp.]
MTDLTLSVTRTIKAPIERVYNAWLDPSTLAQFMMPGEGMSVPKADTDPRVGGRFAITMAAGSDELPHGGEYKELNPHNRIVFTWESPFSIEGSTVTVELNEVAEGTQVELTHVKFPSEDSRNNHESGWANILEALNTVLS